MVEIFSFIVRVLFLEGYRNHKAHTTQANNPTRRNFKNNDEQSITTMPIRSKTPPDPKRQLMIKVKACQRLIKEVAYYEKEVKDNEATLEEMKTSGKDPYDIKKFKEVLDESYMMIPDSKSRLEQSLKDLGEYMESSEVQDLKSSDADNEWYLQGEELLQQQSAKQNTGKGDGDNDDGVKETDVGDLKEGEAF